MKAAGTPGVGTRGNSRDGALGWQDQMLSGVAETFARTIPQFPKALRGVMTNAFLLLRIADIIEDSPALSVEQKRRFLGQYADVVDGRSPVAALVDPLLPALSGGATDAEMDLVRNTATTLRITNGYRDEQREALQRCVRRTTAGMAEFCDTGLGGLRSLRELDRYCYLMSGVAGETITALLCQYSPEIASRRELLHSLASDFGRGVQLVNILRDRWEDRERGVCWLPRDLFPRVPDLVSSVGEPEFSEGIAVLAGIARRHLEGALRFTLLIPRRETGIRRFLLWSLGLMLVVLRRIASNPEFRDIRQVKLRRDIWTTVGATTLAVRSNGILRWMFEKAARGIPAREPRREQDSRAGAAVPP